MTDTITKRLVVCGLFKRAGKPKKQYCPKTRLKRDVRVGKIQRA
ncbi:hypothetical protein [Alteromonas sp. 14N.309.X.WAT.G.H12]